MSLNVLNFRSNIKGDGARPSLFRVRCVAPSWVGFPLEKFTFLANAAELPSSQIGEKIIPYMGQDVKFAGDRVYPDYTLTVINDEDFAIRNAFEAWNNGISQFSRKDSVRTGGATADPTSYVGTIYVDQLTKGGGTTDVLKTYTLYNAWPALVSGIALAWAAKDDIEQFQVSFRYDWLNSSGATN